MSIITGIAVVATVTVGIAFILIRSHSKIGNSLATAVGVNIRKSCPFKGVCNLAAEKDILNAYQQVKCNSSGCR